MAVLKRSPLKPGKGFAPRTAPMSRGTSTLARTEMKRGDSVLKASAKPMQRAAKPMKQRSRTNADPRPKTGEAALCKGQACYLAIPGVCTGQAHDPCHSNQEKHGKGAGIKAHDIYTVPGCRSCHNELDQGMRYTRVEKFAFWDDAYARWQPVRAQLQSSK